MNDYYQGLSVKNQRKTNMDCLLLCEKVVEEEHFGLFVVCDGVGSTAQGGEAATFCAHYLKQWFDGLEHKVRLGLVLQEVVVEMNEALCDYLEEGQQRGATTLSLLLLGAHSSYVVHLGDSRIYGITSEDTRQLTEDQVDEEGRLLGFLGRRQALPLYYWEGERSFSRFLLCSDGFYRRMNQSFLREDINPKDMKEALEKQVDFVIKQGETDNISVILVQCEGWK